MSAEPCPDDWSSGAWWSSKWSSNHSNGPTAYLAGSAEEDAKYGHPRCFAHDMNRAQARADNGCTKSMATRDSSCPLRMKCVNIPCNTRFAFAIGQTCKVDWTCRLYTSPPMVTCIDIPEQGHRCGTFKALGVIRKPIPVAMQCLISQPFANNTISGKQQRSTDKVKTFAHRPLLIQQEQNQRNIRFPHQHRRHALWDTPTTEGTP